MKCVLTFVAFIGFSAWGADNLFDSPLGADEICASRPDMCKGKSRSRGTRRDPAATAKKKTRDLDFADFENVPVQKKPMVKPASGDKSLEGDLDKLAAQDEAKAKQKNKNRKKATKRHDNESLDDFWKRDTAGGMDDEIALLDIEREPAFVKPVVKETKKVIRHRVSFETYLNSNSDHAALSSSYGGRQDAFEQPDRPAILIGASASSVPVDGGAPNSASDASSAAVNSGGSPGGGQSVRENQP